MEKCKELQFRWGRGGGGGVRSEQEHISCFNLLILFLVLSAAFIAALYIDKDLEFVHTFMNVCFFPRLKVRTPPPSMLSPNVLAAFLRERTGKMRRKRS